MRERILVAGIGNIFFGDDAFGVEVARRLATSAPDAVRVRDFGIRGYDLAFALMEGYETVILVDALPRGGAPGTLYTMEPDWPELEAAPRSFDAHRLDPATVLSLVRQMGGTPSRVLLLVGCEPESLGEEDGSMELSASVQAAVEEAVAMLHGLIAKLLGAAPAAAGHREHTEFRSEPNPSGRRTHMKKLIKGLTLAVLVAGIIRFTPDFVRYMKVRSM